MDVWVNGCDQSQWSSWTLSFLLSIDLGSRHESLISIRSRHHLYRALQELLHDPTCLQILATHLEFCVQSSIKLKFHRWFLQLCQPHTLVAYWHNMSIHWGQQCAMESIQIYKIQNKMILSYKILRRWLWSR